MLKIAIVVFRECVEIALLLGIIMALTKKISNSRIYITAGVMVGVIGASIFAFFTKYISDSFAGMGDEIFDSIVILITVLLIIWTIVWMKGYNFELKRKLSDLSDNQNNGYKHNLLLVLVVASTILREGSEIILMVYGISSAEKIDIDYYLIGLGIGALSGLIFGSIIYIGLIKFAGKYIFKISSFLLMLIAAGLSCQAAAKLTSTGIISQLSYQLWDSSWLISDASSGGKLLNAVTGYTARPNGMQLVFYISTICIILILTKLKYNSNLKTNKISNKND
jgi:high-affinity iron transporter